MPAVDRTVGTEPNRQSRRALSRPATILTTPSPDDFREVVDGKRNYVVDGGLVRSMTSIKPEKQFRSRTPMGSFVPLDGLRAAEWVASNRERVLELEHDVLVEEIAYSPIVALREAGNRGTSVHEAIATKILGQSVPDLDDEQRAFFDAAMEFIDSYSVEFVAVEVIAVIDKLGVAGQIDAIPKVGDQTVVLDWKTRSGRHGAYAEEVAQTAGYSMADYLLVGDHPGQRVDMPEIDGLMIVSLKSDGTFEAYPCDLEMGRAAAERMADQFRANLDLVQLGGAAIGDPIKGAAPLPPPDEQLEARRTWMQGRVRALTSEARSYAARTWPIGVPKKAVAMSHQHIDTVSVHLDLVEREHEAPFFNPDPAAPKLAPGSGKPKPAPGSATKPRRTPRGRKTATNNPKG